MNQKIQEKIQKYYEQANSPPERMPLPDTTNIGYVFHSATKGPIEFLSTDIGSDFDIMGKGLYFGTYNYASKYGDPIPLVVQGFFAPISLWKRMLKRFDDLPTDEQRQAAREKLKSDGYDGVVGENVGVVWNDRAVRRAT